MLKIHILNSTTYLTTNNNSTVQNYPQLNKFTVSIPLKAGVTLNNNVELFAGYTLPSSLIANYSDFKGKYTVTQLGVNYFFKITK